MCTYWNAKAFFNRWHDEIFSFRSRIRELMSRNLCEWAQLALDQRALTAILTRSSAVDSAPHPPPPPFCWLAPWAPICAQAELILGPWNNNYRSYSQSIDTEWATNSPAAHPLLQAVPKHKFKLLEVSAPLHLTEKFAVYPSCLVQVTSKIPLLLL